MKNFLEIVFLIFFNVLGAFILLISIVPILIIASIYNLIKLIKRGNAN